MTTETGTADRQQVVSAWFTERLPAAWRTQTPEIEVDREEILVVLPLADSADLATFRDTTREKRIELARQAEDAFGLKVSWGTTKGGNRRLFTTIRSSINAPLGMSERRVLDALVEAGVATNRSEAVSWCIRLVGHHESDWLADLRDAVASAAPRRHRDLPTAI